MKKPRVFSAVWTSIPEGRKYRRWHVEFEDSCGCVEEEDFDSFLTAARFAYHLARGGDRWGFVA